MIDFFADRFVVARVLANVRDDMRLFCFEDSPCYAIVKRDDHIRQFWGSAW